MKENPSLSISKHSGTPNNHGTYETLGIITNSTPSTVSNVNAKASRYTGNGFIVGCDSDNIHADPTYLAPG